VAQSNREQREVEAIAETLKEIEKIQRNMKHMAKKIDSVTTETPNQIPTLAVTAPALLTNIEVLALGKVVASKDLTTTNDMVEAGAYNVDFSVRIRGGVKKGESYEQHIVADIPWVAVAYRLAQEVSAEALARSIERAMGEDDAVVKNWKAENERQLTLLKGKTLRMVRGKVTSALTFERV